MEFTLTINKEITMLGGVPLAAGSIFVGNALNPVSKGDAQYIPYVGLIYANAAAKTALKPALLLELLHAAPTSEAGKARRGRGSEYIVKGAIDTADFTYGVEVVENKAVLTAASFTSLQTEVKKDLATRLEILEGDIS